MRNALGEGAAVLGGPGRVTDGDPGGEATIEVGVDGLLATRDAIGHRSVYWAEPRPGLVVAASTLAGVLGSGLVARSLDPTRVAAFLSCAYLPGGGTLVRGVQALDAGTRLRADATGLRVERWWELPLEGPAGDEAALRAELRALLEEVVAGSLPAGPVGATLSGGIDSSLVLALARRAHGGAARCWSVSFGPPHADELAWSRLVARHLGVGQEVILVRPDSIRARFDEAVRALSEPNGDPLTVPNLLLFEAASAFTDTVLNGEGGDPAFGGPKNAPMLLAELLDAGENRGHAWLRAHQRLYDDLPALLDPRLDPEQARDRLAAEALPDLVSRAGLLDALMATNVRHKGAWHILPKVDHLAAPFGVHPRSPLFDRRVVELAFRVPGPLKRRGSVEKHLLKEAVRDLLPGEVVDRPKSGMMVPVEAWFAGPLKAWARERLYDGLLPRRLVRRGPLEDLVEGRAGGLRPRRGVKLWVLLTLESWLRGHGIAG